MTKQMPSEVKKPAGIRARARAEMDQEIRRIAWEQLQEKGAANLSLRAISREMNMTSSALYRYFKNRDALLTALIIDAYNDVGERAERNDEQIPTGNCRERFLSVGHTVMAWGEENPHRFDLVYGPAIPGYAAPTDTIDPGTRVLMVLYRVISEWSEAQNIDPAIGAPAFPSELDALLQAAAESVGSKATSHQVIAGMALWSELMGTIYSHFFNHFGQELTGKGRVGSYLLEQIATRVFGPPSSPS